jgi:hypothetical protein
MGWPLHLSLHHVVQGSLLQLCHYNCLLPPFFEGGCAGGGCCDAARCLALGPYLARLHDVQGAGWEAVACDGTLSTGRVLCWLFVQASFAEGQRAEGVTCWVQLAH